MTESTDNPTLTDAARRMLAVLNGPGDADNVEALLTGNPATLQAARDMVACYNAAAGAAQERPKWMPVADVPEEWKDGRPCLIYRPDGNPPVCEDWFMDDGESWLKGPTHVMPMPKGPGHE